MPEVEVGATGKLLHAYLRLSCQTMSDVNIFLSCCRSAACAMQRVSLLAVARDVQACFCVLMWGLAEKLSAHIMLIFLAS